MGTWLYPARAGHCDVIRDWSDAARPAGLEERVALLGEHPGITSGSHRRTNSPEPHFRSSEDKVSEGTPIQASEAL
jgi:hypothetical protein